MSRRSRHSVDSYNRIFILGAKSLTPDELRSHFEQFGVVTDVRMLKDSVTKENKGINYVTFEKASEAALAIEKMNGQFIGGLSKPIKVVLANDRSEGNVRDPDEEEKMKRLFIVVPDGHSEDDLRNDFTKYGEIEYIKMLKKNERGTQLAYVKFLSAYHAALALEECDPNYKAVFADTTWNTKRMRQERSRRDPSPHRGSDGPYRKRNRGDYEDTDYMGRDDRYRESSSYTSSAGAPIVYAKLAPHLSPNQVYKLFDLLPGLESCDYNSLTGVVHAMYIDYSCAERAREKLKMLEYPPGYPISIQMSEFPPGRGGENMSDPPFSRPICVDPSVENNFKTLVQTIEKAAAFIQNSGLGMNNFAAPSAYSNEPLNPSRYTDIPLPPVKPLAPIDSPVVERLHFSSCPDLIPVNILTDVFGRFGGLIRAEYIPGKYFGFASFAIQESAHQAIETLNEQVICGNRLRVSIAEPLKSPPRHESWGAGSYVDRQN